MTRSYVSSDKVNNVCNRLSRSICLLHFYSYLTIYYHKILILFRGCWNDGIIDITGIFSN